MSWTYVGTVGPVSEFKKIDGRWYFVIPDGIMTEVTNAKSVAKLEREEALWKEHEGEILAELDKLMEK
jgi:hypothetical protein